MELSELLPIFMGLVGVFIGGWIQKSGQREILHEERAFRIAAENLSRKQSITCEIFTNWDSLDNLKGRTEAYKIIEKEEYKSLNYYQLFDKIGANDWPNIGRMFHFFESIGDLLEANQLDPKLYRILFNRDVSFWAPRLLSRLDADTSRARAIRLALEAIAAPHESDAPRPWYLV